MNMVAAFGTTCKLVVTVAGLMVLVSCGKAGAEITHADAPSESPTSGSVLMVNCEGIQEAEHVRHSVRARTPVLAAKAVVADGDRYQFIDAAPDPERVWVDRGGNTIASVFVKRRAGGAWVATWISRCGPDRIITPAPSGR